MFSKHELQVIGQTLIQRRDWLTKNIHKPEMANAKTQNERTLQIIESAVLKITNSLRAPAEATATEVTRDGVNHYVSQPSVSPSRQAVLDRRQNVAPADIRVLIVDDDQLICDLLSAYLAEIGITQIDTANDGMKGINMMFNANPIYDLVLCDWNMPAKSGIDVHNAMRAAERYHHAIFMLVTAVTEASQIRSAIQEGVDDYVVKPIEQDKLAKKIGRFFQQVRSTSTS
ncbi:MAG TPA: response regulator [Cellvibrio sp.]|nr:response regulator [Cellvibrio sp.]